MVHFFWAVCFIYMQCYTQDEDEQWKCIKKNKAEGEDKGELWLSAGKEDKKESYVCKNHFLDLRSNVKRPDTKSQAILTAYPPLHWLKC